MLFISSCDIANQNTDGGINTMSVEFRDSLYQLTNVKGGHYMSERFYRGDLFGKTMYIKTYYKDWKNDTCNFVYYDIGNYSSNSYVSFDTMYNLPNFGKIIRSSLEAGRETGSFNFAIISGRDTLYFTNGKYNIYSTPLK